MKKIIASIFLVFFLATTAIGCRDKDGTGTRAADITLTVWGIFDSESDLYNIFASFKKKFPEVRIEYRAIPLKEYEKILLNAIADGTGPDVFLIHNTWLPKFKNKLAPAPADKVPFEAVQQTFVSVVEDDFTDNGETYALPLYVDSLGVLYNYDDYRKTKIGKPRESWTDFLEDINSITEVAGKAIVHPGIAFGTANNVNQSADILMNLFLQYGLEFYSESGKTTQISTAPGLRAFDYYTSFANPKSDHFSWTEERKDDTYEFINGDVSTIINYSYLIEQVAAQARTSGLEFRTAKFPQFDTQKPIYFADYWGYGAKKNPEKDLRVRYAWELIKHMASKESAEDYFSRTHRPPARRELIDANINDPLYGPFIEQARFARSIKMYDREVYNDALNEAISSIFKDIGSTEALKKAAGIINDRISLYLGN